MEGTHRELRSRFADRLRRDDAGRFAEFDESPGSQVTSVAHDANAALRFAGQHRANFHALDTGRLNRARQLFGDFMVDVDYHLSVVVFDFFERHAANNSVAQRLDDLAGFDDTRDVNSVHGAAVVFADDHVLRHVDQTPRQIARVGGFERRIGQSFAGAVRRNEVFEHRQTFTEVRGDRRLDDFTRRLGHQSAHAGELTNLLFRSASARVRHDVNRIEFTFLVAPLHLAEHFVGNFLRDGRPDFDDLVVAFPVGDRAVQILLLHGDDRLVRVLHKNLLVVRE